VFFQGVVIKGLLIALLLVGLGFTSELKALANPVQEAYSHGVICWYDGKPDVPPYFHRGNSFLSMSKYANAIDDFNRALQFNPKFAPAYANRASIYIAKGKYELAMADCNTAIELDPKLSYAYSNRAIASTHLGQFEQAVSDVQMAVKLNPDDLRCYFACEPAYQTAGKPEIADTNPHRLVQAEDNDGETKQ